MTALGPLHDAGKSRLALEVSFGFSRPEYRRAAAHRIAADLLDAADVGVGDVELTYRGDSVVVSAAVVGTNVERVANAFVQAAGSAAARAR